MLVRIEHPNQTNLVVLETRAELDCLLKFIIDEFQGSSATKYAIGLQSPDHYKGRCIKAYNRFFPCMEGTYPYAI